MRIKAAVSIIASLALSCVLTNGSVASVQDGETVSGVASLSVEVNYDSAAKSRGDFWYLDKICVYVDQIPIDTYQKKVTASGMSDPYLKTFDLYPKAGCASESNTDLFYFIEDFRSIDFNLNTSLLANGDHVISVVLVDTDGIKAPTYLNFTTSNTNIKFAVPNITFNSEIFNCYDCLAIGVPYLLSWSIGASAKGSPAEVSSRLKLNNKWRGWTKAGRKNGKYIAKINLPGKTWIEVRAKWDGKYYYYKQLLNPGYTFVVNGPDTVRVGKTGTAKVRLPGVKTSRCVITEDFYGEYGHSYVKKFASTMYGGALIFSRSNKYPGTLDVTLECQIPGGTITGGLGWEVSYW